jgi:hypothetical protein
MQLPEPLAGVTSSSGKETRTGSALLAARPSAWTSVPLPSCISPVETMGVASTARWSSLKLTARLALERRMSRASTLVCAGEGAQSGQLPPWHSLVQIGEEAASPPPPPPLPTSQLLPDLCTVMPPTLSVVKPSRRAALASQPRPASAPPDGALLSRWLASAAA